MSTCANCGEGEECSDDLKACTACNLVKYCNRECQIAHRPQHKKACKKRAAELYDETLFKDPPSPEDCPICFLPLPCAVQVTFFSCCGKLICNGCLLAVAETGAKVLCPFCRIPPNNSDEEEVNRVKQLTEKDNACACYQLGTWYANGTNGLPLDHAKAEELYLKAGQLGFAVAYYNLGCAYEEGTGVDVDTKKAKYYYELAAINGHVMARHNLGNNEGRAGNHQRAMKHLLLAARAGHTKALNTVKGGYMDGFITKEEYANTLREYQKCQDEMKSDARDKALAVSSRS